MQARLDPERFEDLVSFLVEVGVRADARFDPGYGDGGQARTTYLYRRMRPRIVDWYRHTMGDGRYLPDRTKHPRSAIPFADASELSVAAGYAFELTFDSSMSLAVESLAAGISDAGRETLATIVRPLAEGFRVQEIARGLGITTAKLDARLEQLRAELAPSRLEPNLSPREG